MADVELLGKDGVDGININGWEIKCSSSHISGLVELEKLEEALGKDFVLPEMVFGSNVLSLRHTGTGVTISFNAKDALEGCRLKEGEEGGIHAEIQVKAAEEWAKRPSMAKTMKASNDWTYTTDYTGTLSEGGAAEATEFGIDYAKLRVREEILWFKEVHLYEDELHDNGDAQCSVKIRVMKSCFFILLRLFLRVDDVLLRMVDTRFFHEFGTGSVTRERKILEETFENLIAKGHSSQPSHYSDPNKIQGLLRQISLSNDRIALAPLGTDIEIKEA